MRKLHTEESIVSDELIVNANWFAYTNASGGTNMSDSQFNERFAAPIRARITSGFYDYEVGFRFRAVAADDPALVAYLERNASPSDRRIYFSQHDLEDKRLLRRIVELLGIAEEEHAPVAGYRVRVG